MNNLLGRHCLGLVLVLLSACGHEAKKDPLPQVNLPARFLGKSGEGPSLPQRWWTSFGDDELNRLVDNALRSNAQLDIAWARLRQAQAALDLAQATWFPTITVGVDGQGTQRVFRGPFGPGGTDQNVVLQQLLYTGSIGASYEIDLWGRLAAQRKAAMMDAAATRGQLDAAAMTIAAQVTDTFLNGVAQHAQLALLKEQLRINEALFEILTLRFKRGVSPSFEALQQQQQVSAARAQIVQAEGQLEILGQRLAILIGRPPEEVVDIGRRSLPALPPLPPTGVPADLLRRRPDVRAARLRVEAADHRVGAALAERFPPLVLNGSIGLAATSITAAYDLVWNFLVGLTETVFDGGRRAARIEQSRAVLDEHLAGYRDVVLQALLEVETTLVQERKLDEQIGLLRQQVVQAGLTLEQARASYLEGLTGYLSVLTALDGKHRVEQGLLSAERQRLANRVALFRALGGTFTDDLAAPGTISHNQQKKSKP